MTSKVAELPAQIIRARNRLQLSPTHLSHTMGGPPKAFGKRKRKAAQSGPKTRPRLEKQDATRSAGRTSRTVTRATDRLSLLNEEDDDSDDLEEAEDDNEEEDAESEDLGAPLSLTSTPRLPPKVIHSEKLPILLSLVSPLNIRTHKP